MSFRQFAIRVLVLYLLAPMVPYALIVGPLLVIGAPSWVLFGVGLVIGSATGPVLLFGIPSVHKWVYGW